MTTLARHARHAAAPPTATIAPPVPEPVAVAPGQAAGSHDLPVLEAYRAGAAVLVLLTHVGFASGAGLRGPWAGWLARGDAGVPVFFILSGFLLMRPWVLADRGAGPAVRTAPYLWRRAVRLVPAYVVAAFGVAVLVPSAAARPFPDWARAATLTGTYHDGPLLPGFTHTWSLGTEISFYVALPLLAVLWLGPAGRNRRRSRLARWRVPVVVVLLVAVAATWRVGWALSRDGNLVPLTWLPGYLDWFGAGMLLAWLRERRGDGGPAVLRAAAQAPGAWFSTALVVYWVATTPLGGPYDLSPVSASLAMLKHDLYLVFGVCLLVPGVFGEPTGRWQVVARSRPLVWAGTISYGFFLWHMVVLQALVERLDLAPFNTPFLPLLAGVTVLSVGLAALSWHLLERPLQRRLRNVVR